MEFIQEDISQYCELGKSSSWRRGNFCCCAEDVLRFESSNLDQLPSPGPPQVGSKTGALV